MDISRILNSVIKKLSLNKARGLFPVGSKQPVTDASKVSDNLSQYPLDYKKYESDSNIQRNSIVNLSLDMREHLDEGESKNIAGIGARLRLEVPDKVDVYFREYQESDPPSKIDWKAYARTDNLFVRQTKGQAHLKVLIVVDRSESMRWSMKEDILSKEAISYRVSGYLARVHLEREDELSFCMLNEKSSSKIYRIKTYEECKSIYDKSNIHINTTNDKDEDTINISISSLQDGELISEFDHRNYDLIYIFSDALDPSYKQFISSSTIFFHTLSVYELDPRWMNQSSVYYSRNPHISYSGSKLLDGRYPGIINSWLKQVREDTVKKCDYMLLCEMISVGELFECINLVFKERRNKR